MPIRIDDEDEPVPTAAELAKRGAEFAEAVAWNAKGEATVWRIHDAGHKLIGEILRRNGRRGEGRVLYRRDEACILIDDEQAGPSESAGDWSKSGSGPRRRR